MIKAFKALKSHLTVSKPYEYKEEFEESLYMINNVRGKYIALLFIFLEILILILTVVMKRNRIYKGNTPYYISMYIIQIIAMTIFLFIFMRIEKKKSPHYLVYNKVTGIIFTTFILCFSAGISLLDQESNNEIIVYICAALASAVTPYLEPGIMFLIYLFVQIGFIMLMPYFNKAHVLPFGNTINSTTFIIFSWVIALMRYKKYIEEFKSKKIIEEKNKELKLINIKLEEANKKLEKFSQVDALTGISNRFMFDKTIKMEWNRLRREEKCLSLIMIDIDFFKYFNDNYGHQAGDYCLRCVAEALSQCTKRSSDTVARYGGEEFAIILPYANKDDAYNIAEKMRKAVEGLSIFHDNSLTSKHITISLGVNSVIPSDNNSIEAFIKEADEALYSAKAFRNKTIIYKKA